MLNCDIQNLAGDQSERMAGQQALKFGREERRLQAENDFFSTGEQKGPYDSMVKYNRNS